MRSSTSPTGPSAAESGNRSIGENNYYNLYNEQNNTDLCGRITITIHVKMCGTYFHMYSNSAEG